MKEGRSNLEGSSVPRLGDKASSRMDDESLLKKVDCLLTTTATYPFLNALMLHLVTGPACKNRSVSQRHFCHL
jgi:hypothetical protein